MGTPLRDITLPKSDDLIGLSSDKYSCAFNDPKSLHSTWIMNINEREVRAAERVCCVWLWASKPRWMLIKEKDVCRATGQSLHRRPQKRCRPEVIIWRMATEYWWWWSGVTLVFVLKRFRPLQTGCGLFVQINDTHKKCQTAGWARLFPHRMWISRCEKGTTVIS